MQVRLLGTGGAANEGRHQACLLVGWGDEAVGGRLLLDAGGGLDVVRRLDPAWGSAAAAKQAETELAQPDAEPESSV